MKLERAELRAAVQATEAAAEDTGGKVMDASFAEFPALPAHGQGAGRSEKG